MWNLLDGEEKFYQEACEHESTVVAGRREGFYGGCVFREGIRNIIKNSLILGIIKSGRWREGR